MLCVTCCAVQDKFPSFRLEEDSEEGPRKAELPSLPEAPSLEQKDWEASPFSGFGPFTPGVHPPE